MESVEGAEARPTHQNASDKQEEEEDLQTAQEQPPAETESSTKKRRKRKKKKGKQPKAEAAELDWDVVDLEFERVRYNTQLHQDLRSQLDKKLSARDEWNKKANVMRNNALKDLDMEAQMEALKLRGQAATMESKRHIAETKAYTLTYRRAMALDREVFALLKQIRELEDDPALKLDPSNMLNAAMRAAIEDDDPGKLKASLDQLHNPHLFRREADKMIRSRPELEIMELKESIRRTSILAEKERALEKEKKKAAKKAAGDAACAEEAPK